MFLNKSPELRARIHKDLRANLEKFNDPVVLGELIFLLYEERENTNRILKNLLQKIEQLERRLAEKETVQQKQAKPPLPQIDQEIVEFVRKKGNATALDVKNRFGYKGTNGASARLNKLCELGYLKKSQVGRKVYFSSL